ncbi:MAG: hypothetical protein AAGD05_06505 [Bacteroidota bacterium]
MKKTELKSMSTEALKKKEKETKTLIGVFIPIILGLLYFSFRDYFMGEEVDMPILIITLCSIGGMVSLIPELRQVQEEWNNRNELD